tara:strand:+ start:127 stop:717 length:591 start_codon:yes stop_codon:yes gene_type:complete
MSLSITVGSGGGGAWENAPTGIFKATCCDVIDLGRQETEHGNKHQCELHFELDKAAGFVEATGNQFTVRTQRYNLPEPGHQLHEKSSLFKFLSGWRGKTLQPGDDIELEKLVGVHAHLVLGTQTSQKGTEYTAITTASPKNKNEVFPPLSGAYKRRVVEAAPVDAPEIQAPETAQTAPVQPAPAPAANLDDDDVPF